jgi:hypothetical protein
VVVDWHAQQERTEWGAVCDYVAGKQSPGLHQHWRRMQGREVRQTLDFKACFLSAYA